MVLVIDEVSMMSGQLFDALGNIAMVVREHDRPFGGLQLVLVGDFLQLPPVAAAATWAFEAEAWARCNVETCLLTRVFRQTDEAFVKALADVRRGVMTIAAEAVLRGCVRRPGRDFAGVKLKAYRRSAVKVNREAFNALRGATRR
jgi:ATP-dependent DNA helicase PIF1